MIGYSRKIRVVEKFVYGGMFVDKYFCKLDNGDVVQVRQSDWDLNKKGEPFVQTIYEEEAKKSKTKRAKR